MSDESEPASVVPPSLIPVNHPLARFDFDRLWSPKYPLLCGPEFPSPLQEVFLLVRWEHLLFLFPIQSNTLAIWKSFGDVIRFKEEAIRKVSKHIGLDLRALGNRFPRYKMMAVEWLGSESVLVEFIFPLVPFSEDFESRRNYREMCPFVCNKNPIFASQLQVVNRFGHRYRRGMIHSYLEFVFDSESILEVQMKLNRVLDESLLEKANLHSGHAFFQANLVNNLVDPGCLEINVDLIFRLRQQRRVKDLFLECSSFCPQTEWILEMSTKEVSQPLIGCCSLSLESVIDGIHAWLARQSAVVVKLPPLLSVQFPQDPSEGHRRVCECDMFLEKGSLKRHAEGTYQLCAVVGPSMCWVRKFILSYPKKPGISRDLWIDLWDGVSDGSECYSSAHFIRFLIDTGPDVQCLVYRDTHDDESTPISSDEVVDLSVAIERLKLGSFCTVCGQSKAKRCARCYGVRYCSKSCQTNHWSQHRLSCSRLSREGYEQERWKKHQRKLKADNEALARSLSSLFESEEALLERMAEMKRVQTAATQVRRTRSEKLTQELLEEEASRASSSQRTRSRSTKKRSRRSRKKQRRGQQRRGRNRRNRPEKKEEEQEEASVVRNLSETDAIRERARLKEEQRDMQQYVQEKIFEAERSHAMASEEKSPMADVGESPDSVLGDLSNNLDVSSLQELGEELPGSDDDEDVASSEPVLTQPEMCCVVCMEAIKTVLFLPCQHMSCCMECASVLKNCPRCRGVIEQKIEAFL